ncbi:MAG: hypothetical protein IJY50_05625 [Clostridia bacterium]|nr:hypothetical protein [Clostridia bacterium]
MQKKDLKIPALLMFGIYILYSCALVPLYQLLSADIVLMNTIWWDVVDFLMNLFEVLGIATVIACLLYALYHYSLKACLPMYLLIGGVLLFKYIASLIAISIVGGSLDLTSDFSSFFISFALEIIELVFVALLGNYWIASLKRENEALEKANAALGKEFTPHNDFFPFQKPLSRTNPLQRTAFWGFVLITVFRLISYVIADVTYGLMGYGFSTEDIPVTLLYWLLLIFIPSIAGYFCSLGWMLLLKHKNP